VDQDLAIRLAAFAWLSEKTGALGDVLPRQALVQGFVFEGTRVPLVSPQGIFKPRIMELPLSISTTPEGPYRDTFSTDGLLSYKYRGNDREHGDNVGLRKLMDAQRPLAYFHGVVPGRYVAVWPVYVVADDPSSLTFRVAVDDLAAVQMEGIPLAVAELSGRRTYITATVRIRLHQRMFRERVLDAYRSQCSLCRLRHRELLEAAHIIPDTDAAGEPRITNGIALCQLHHGAFDAFILGVSPDYRVHLRQDVLDEIDGPLLLHGLQELHGASLILPTAETNWPSRDALAWRFDQFTRAA